MANASEQPTSELQSRGVILQLSSLTQVCSSASLLAPRMSARPSPLAEGSSLEIKLLLADYDAPIYPTPADVRATMETISGPRVSVWLRAGCPVGAPITDQLSWH